MFRFRHARLCNVWRVNPLTASGSSTWFPHRFIPRRGYASEWTPPPQGSSSSSSLKPKAHTPLRRTASDSLSIRTNPKPTQSEIQPISTLATAERYLLTRLRTRLPLALGARPLHGAYWVPKWSSSSNNGDGGKREGEVFIFSNGSFVCWGLTEEDAVRFRTDVLIPANAEVGTLAEPETEELEFATDPSECVSSTRSSSSPCPCLNFPMSFFFFLLLKEDATTGRPDHPRGRSPTDRPRRPSWLIAAFGVPSRDGLGALRLLASPIALDRAFRPRDFA